MTSLIRPPHYSDHVFGYHCGTYLYNVYVVFSWYSSIGMALAAMEAMNNLNLFGDEVGSPCCLL